ncbi:DNA cytosine methyltransferase [Bradyrhizobium sp. 38]|uniref:DNA cytosine methyltransferase n=1 Tax=unclassified Bradyrhizobium TaxID=2631580 RepID=UPI001FF8EC40|nr:MULTISPECIES: DNA cytosine methyltransferase [unclassified Bradyrhizobium]MCK1341499.1 DNA cytosine methyltransferase [Bradyrhizobium sp. 38]MCK1775668.1 DNA cytosine methyltransferase [Bradyrhizobium sp. 132]
MGGKQRKRAKAATKKAKLGRPKSLSCVDLFAGAGGFSLAADRAGLSVKLAVEHNRHACATYRHNFRRRKTELKEGDITLMSPRKIAVELFGAGDFCDLLLGGPPCQGFSAHRLNDAGVEDPRNHLIHTYFDFVKAFEPSMFLMENVPGMLWSRHADFLAEFYRKAKSSGYDVREPVTIDARDHGVPQRRKRVFILEIKKGVDTGGLTWPPARTHGSPTARSKDKSLKAWVSCASVFRHFPDEDENSVFMNSTQELVEIFRATPLNGGSRKDSGRMLECHKDHDGHKDVYGRIDPRQPAPTMTTACINPSKGRFVHPRQHHGITVRQAARIQTFPDDFVFKGGLMAAGVQIGNAVPVKLGETLVRALRPFIRKARRQREDGAD